jgi:hypothetical protein
MVLFNNGRERLVRRYVFRRREMEEGSGIHGNPSKLDSRPSVFLQV